MCSDKPPRKAANDKRVSLTWRVAQARLIAERQITKSLLGKDKTEEYREIMPSSRGPPVMTARAGSRRTATAGSAHVQGDVRKERR